MRQKSWISFAPSSLHVFVARGNEKKEVLKNFNFWGFAP